MTLRRRTEAQCNGFDSRQEESTSAVPRARATVAAEIPETRQSQSTREGWGSFVSRIGGWFGKETVEGGGEGEVAAVAAERVSREEVTGDVDACGMSPIKTVVRKRQYARIKYLCGWGEGLGPIGLHGVDSKKVAALGDIQIKELMEVAKILIVDYPTRKFSLLTMAAILGKNYCVKIIINELGVDAGQVDGEGRNALTAVVECESMTSGQLDVFKWLLERARELVNKKDDNGRLPIVRAACFGRVAVVKRLLEVGANVELCEKDGWNALTAVVACETMTSGHMKVLEILSVRAQELVNKKDDNGRLPIEIIVEKGHTTVGKLLCGAGVDLSQIGLPRVDSNLVARLGDTQITMIMKLAKILIVDNSSKKFSLLTLAAELGEKDGVEIIIQRLGVDAGQVDGEGWNALTAVVAYETMTPGHLDVIRWLCKRGVDLSKIGLLKVPSNLVARLGDTQITMIMRLAKILIVDNSSKKFSLLTLAATLGKKDCVKIIIKRLGVDAGQVDGEGWNALTIVVASKTMTLGQLDVFKWLLGRAPRLVNQKDDNGRLPIVRAAYLGHWEAVNKLLEVGANVGLCEEDGWNALTALVMCRQVTSGHMDMLELLLKEFPELLNQRDGKGRLPIVRTAYLGRVEVVKRLLDVGADVGFCEKNGWNALTVVVAYKTMTSGHLEVFKLLLARAPRLVNQKDGKGRLPIKIIVEKGCVEAFRKLCEARADLTPIGLPKVDSNLVATLDDIQITELMRLSIEGKPRELNERYGEFTQTPVVPSLRRLFGDDSGERNIAGGVGISPEAMDRARSLEWLRFVARNMGRAIVGVNEDPPFTGYRRVEVPVNDGKCAIFAVHTAAGLSAKVDAFFYVTKFPRGHKHVALMVKEISLEGNSPGDIPMSEGSSDQADFSEGARDSDSFDEYFGLLTHDLFVVTDSLHTLTDAAKEYFYPGNHRGQLLKSATRTYLYTQRAGRGVLALNTMYAIAKSIEDGNPYPLIKFGQGASFNYLLFQCIGWKLYLAGMCSYELYTLSHRVQDLYAVVTAPGYKEARQDIYVEMSTRIQFEAPTILDNAIVMLYEPSLSGMRTLVADTAEFTVDTVEYGIIRGGDYLIENAVVPAINFMGTKLSEYREFRAELPMRLELDQEYIAENWQELYNDPSCENLWDLARSIRALASDAVSYKIIVEIEESVNQVSNRLREIASFVVSVSEACYTMASSSDTQRQVRHSKGTIEMIGANFLTASDMVEHYNFK